MMDKLVSTPRRSITIHPKNVGNEPSLMVLNFRPVDFFYLKFNLRNKKTILLKFYGFLMDLYKLLKKNIKKTRRFAWKSLLENCFKFYIFYLKKIFCEIFCTFFIEKKYSFYSKINPYDFSSFVKKIHGFGYYFYVSSWSGVYFFL